VSGGLRQVLDAPRGTRYHGRAMLDYNLVSSLATYRMPKPEDIPVLVDLVERFHAETRTGLHVGQPEVLATLKELNQHRRSGSWFVFEMEEEVVGYCLIANRWSNGLGGAELHVDELYVMPGRRGRGIASDFLGLLAKVAPGDAAAIRVELPAANRRAQGLLRRLGYIEAAERVMSRPLRGARVAPGG
jgi:ribosomal protein S18 acetylase RimI-like enzyme